MSLKSFVLLVAAIFAVLHSANSYTSPDGKEYDCRCTLEYFPVCASNGLTYENWCIFDCVQDENHDLKVNYEDECQQKV